MSENKRKASFWAKVGKALVPLMLIVAGGVAWSYFKATAPVMELAAPRRQVAVVDVRTVRKGDARIVVAAMGTVVAAREVTLSLDIRKVTLADAAETIANASVELGGGSLKTAGGDILVRVKDRRDYADPYARLPLLTRADGSQLMLGDVVTVREGFEDTHAGARFNGDPAVMIEIYRVGDQTPTQVADAGQAVLERLNPILPEGLRLTVLEDDSQGFTQRAELLLKNAFQGLILVFVFLALFLETRLAFWVSLGISVSFMGSFIFLSATDFSINICDSAGSIRKHPAGTQIHNPARPDRPLPGTFLQFRRGTKPRFAKVSVPLVSGSLLALFGIYACWRSLSEAIASR